MRANPKLMMEMIPGSEDDPLELNLGNMDNQDWESRYQYELLL